MQGLLHRLKQTPELLQQYDNIIRDQIDKRIVEPVPETNFSLTLCHYIPHHAVVRSDKTTTKLRIVYDASARSGGPSLNDCLHKGPKFNQQVFDILLRFRASKISLVADLEKAFLMVSVSEDDRDVLRYLWVNDINEEPPVVSVLRFTRVIFGVSSSPFLLNAVIKYHLERHSDTHPDLVQLLLRSTYVDDIITGASTEDEAFNLYAQSKEIFLNGGFNLRKFHTNSPWLQKRIDCSESLRDSANRRKDECQQLEETYVETTLGDQWESRKSSVCDGTPPRIVLCSMSLP